MHRLTEQRWAGLFYILLTCALVFQLIAFVCPGWLRVFIRFKKYYKAENRAGYHETAVNQDYSLWYMSQCKRDTWHCETLSYYHIRFMDEPYDDGLYKKPDHWFLERTHLYLNGAEIRFSYDEISEYQTEYVLGLLACALAWWLVHRHRKRLTKKSLEKLSKRRLIAAAGSAFFAGLFVLIPVGCIGVMGDRLRSVSMGHPNDVVVYKPIGLGFAAVGGTLAMVTGIVIVARMVLRKHCPDCVDVEQQDEIAMRETANQVESAENYQQ